MFGTGLSCASDTSKYSLLYTCTSANAFQFLSLKRYVIKCLNLLCDAILWLLLFLKHALPIVLFACGPRDAILIPQIPCHPKQLTHCY